MNEGRKEGMNKGVSVCMCVCVYALHACPYQYKYVLMRPSIPGISKPSLPARPCEGQLGDDERPGKVQL